MRDLNEVLDLTLNLPIGGKTYVVHPPTADIGAHLSNLLLAGVAADAGIDVPDLPDAPDLPDLATMCLGPALTEMTTDGLSQRQLDFAVETAYLAWTISKPYALAYWEAGGKVARPNRAQRRRPTVTPTLADAARTTRIPGSASGTKTSRKKRRKRA